MRPLPGQPTAEVAQLLDGLDVVELAESDAPGRAFSGPKHWHTFTVGAGMSAEYVGAAARIAGMRATSRMGV